MIGTDAQEFAVGIASEVNLAEGDAVTVHRLDQGENGEELVYWRFGE